MGPLEARALSAFAKTLRRLSAERLSGRLEERRRVAFASPEEWSNSARGLREQVSSDLLAQHKKKATEPSAISPKREVGTRRAGSKKIEREMRQTLHERALADRGGSPGRAPMSRRNRRVDGR